MQEIRTPQAAATVVVWGLQVPRGRQLVVAEPAQLAVTAAQTAVSAATERTTRTSLEPLTGTEAGLLVVAVVTTRTRACSPGQREGVAAVAMAPQVRMAVAIRMPSTECQTPEVVAVLSSAGATPTAEAVAQASS